MLYIQLQIKTAMKSIFEESVYQELLFRIAVLNEKSERQWGKMTAGQMALHCQFPIKIGVDNKHKGNGNLFVRMFFKKTMYNDTPLRKNLPTDPNLGQKRKKIWLSKKQY